MLLAIDVGNTNIVLGVFDDNKLICSGRIATKIYETDEEYAMKISSFLQIHNASDIDGAIISSVVPALTRSLEKSIQLISDVESIVIVGPGVKTGLNIKIDDPAQLGADLVVGAVAAKNKYKCPVILFDLGTATTATVLDKDGNCLGGMIAAGVKTSLNALSSGTAQLPQIDISAPAHAIGTNTVDSMKSGAVIGTAVMIEGLTQRFEEELGSKATVVVTGGLGKSICENCRIDVEYDADLLLDGLLMIYNKNIESK